MKLNIRILTNLLLLCAFFRVDAKELSFSEVIGRVQDRFHTNGIWRAQCNSNLEVSHVQRLKDKDKIAYYILDKGNNQGFIVAPADDIFPVVLGYTETGNFDIDSIPPALKWYLEEFEKTVDESGSVYSMVSSFESAEDWAPIAPLLDSK